MSLARPLARPLSRWGRGASAGAQAGPVNTAAPVVTVGDDPAVIGTLLSVTTGDWTTPGTLGPFEYQWRRAGVPIDGATANTHALSEGEDDLFVNCQVTATDEFGSRTRLSNSVGPFNLVDLSGGTLLFGGDDLAYSGDGITYNPE